MNIMEQVKKRIGQLITAYREKTKLTQTQLARRMGTSQPLISKLEKGNSLPKKRTLEKLSKIFDEEFLNEIKSIFDGEIGNDKNDLISTQEMKLHLLNVPGEIQYMVVKDKSILGLLNEKELNQIIRFLKNIGDLDTLTRMLIFERKIVKYQE